jgi:hypothetical protein
MDIKRFLIRSCSKLFWTWKNNDIIHALQSWGTKNNDIIHALQLWGTHPRDILNGFCVFDALNKTKHYH